MTFAENLQNFILTNISRVDEEHLESVKKGLTVINNKAYVMVWVHRFYRLKTFAEGKDADDDDEEI